jgi:hypothetical protein
LKIVSEHKGAEKQRRKGIFMFDCAPQGHGHCLNRDKFDAEEQQATIGKHSLRLRASASRFALFKQPLKHLRTLQRIQEKQWFALVSF